MSDINESTTEYALRISEEIKRQLYLIEKISKSITYVEKLFKDDLAVSIYANGNHIDGASPMTKRIIRSMVLSDLHGELKKEQYKLKCILK